MKLRMAVIRVNFHNPNFLGGTANTGSRRAEKGSIFEGAIFQKKVIKSNRYRSSPQLKRRYQ